MDWITLGMLMTVVVVGGMAGLFHQGDSRKRTQALFEAADRAEKKAEAQEKDASEWLPVVDAEVLEVE